MIDEAKAIAVIEAAKDVFRNKELITNSAEAKLVLALNDFDPNFIKGKEDCSCGEQDTCDECWTKQHLIDWLKAHAEK